MLRRSLAETARSGDHLRTIHEDGRHVCCDQCCGASLAGCREVVKPCACAGIEGRYRRSLDHYGRVDRAMANGQVRAWIGKAKATACACDGTERESDLEGGNCILKRQSSRKIIGHIK